MNAKNAAVLYKPFIDCSAANVIYSNSHLRICGYGVNVGKVRIISASTSALYHFEHPHILRYAHPHFTRGLTSRKSYQRVIGLGVLVHEETHPSIPSFLTVCSFQFCTPCIIVVWQFCKYLGWWHTRLLLQTAQLCRATKVCTCKHAKCSCNKTRNKHVVKLQTTTI